MQNLRCCMCIHTAFARLRPAPGVTFLFFLIYRRLRTHDDAPLFHPPFADPENARCGAFRTVFLYFSPIGLSACLPCCPQAKTKPRTSGTPFAGLHRANHAFCTLFHENILLIPMIFRRRPYEYAIHTTSELPQEPSRKPPPPLASPRFSGYHPPNACPRSLDDYVIQPISSDGRSVIAGRRVAGTLFSPGNDDSPPYRLHRTSGLSRFAGRSVADRKGIFHERRQRHPRPAPR